MRHVRSIGLVTLALALLTTGAPAQETRTSKERLSRKWFDEQRVDNCRVPLDKRGTTPRPDCVGEATTSAARAETQSR